MTNTYSQQPGVAVSNIKIEGLNLIEGITQIHPRLSWQIQSNQRNVVQTAYQIIVATS
ncbi:MAG: hypothetical protein H7325_09630, partial [Pedobacter sp.]|nr:hypothetical protein [Pedobacter sp.]